MVPLPDYDEMLLKLRSELSTSSEKPQEERLEIPKPQVLWVGNKTFLRNFMDYPRIFRREPEQILLFLAKELATAASMDGDRAIFIGRRNPESFKVLFERYIKAAVICPVCGRPDTHLEKSKRLQFLVCEACGARSPAKFS